MAKPISFTKRDLEKKKQEKRLAKQQKKEDEWSVHLIKKLRANIIIIDTNQYALD